MPKYMRHKETMIYFHYFATKTRPIYFSIFRENFILISSTLRQILQKSIGDVISVVKCICEISSLYLASLAVQAWSQTPKTGFLMTRLICKSHLVGDLVSWLTVTYKKLRPLLNTGQSHVGAVGGV